MQGTQVLFLVWEDSKTHAKGYLSPCAPTTEPVLWNPYSAIGEATAGEAHALRLESGPCSPQLERARTAVKAQRSQALIT